MTDCPNRGYINEIMDEEESGTISSEQALAQLDQVEATMDEVETVEDERAVAKAKAKMEES